MHNISSLICRENSKKLKRNKNTEPLKKENCLMYKVGVLNVSSNSYNRNGKKVYVGSTQGPFKQRYYNHKSNYNFIVTKLICPVTNRKSKKNLV